MIKASEPDFSVHGHVHQAPTAPGGSWIWESEKTIAFNPGQSPRGESPHYILLELRGPGDWSATWHGIGRELKAGTRTA
jgi:Icc-related predicted phosphoesterase